MEQYNKIKTKIKEKYDISDIIFNKILIGQINLRLLLLQPTLPIKKINGITSVFYFNFNHLSQNYKIMICGTIHNYCYNDSFCDKEFDIINKSYNLTYLIKYYSENKCIDLFTETALDERLKTTNFNYDLFTNNKSSGESRVNKKYIFLNMINNRFLYNQTNFFLNEKQKPLTPLEIKNLSQSDFIKVFNKTCKFHETLFTEDILIDFYNYIQSNNPDTINSYSELKINSIFNYINYSIEGKLRNFTQIFTKNIRHHLWDIRTIRTKKQNIGYPLFFLPEFLELDTIIEINTPEQKDKFNSYKIEIRKHYHFEDKNNPNKIISLIFFLSNSQFDDTSKFYYSEGKKFYNKLYDTFYSFYETEIEGISFNKNITINEFSKLIQKQLNNSIFKTDLVKFFKIYILSVNREIFNKMLDPSISAKMKSIMFYYDFEVGLFFSDIYSISRIFKKNFNPKKNLKNDLCDQTDYFKNIIYVGGRLHSDILINFIMNYFKVKINLSSIAKFPKKRCIEFDSPVEFFND
jgi:hypothetical protein